MENLLATVKKDTPPGELVRLMVGRELEAITETGHARKEIKFEVKNISGKGFKDISFKLHKGEILGFAGLEGSGRTAMAKALFGDEKLQTGEILQNGKRISIKHPSDALDHGIVYLPEDRKMEGLFLAKTISENIFSARLKKGLYHEAAANKESNHLCKAFGIRTPTVKQEMRKLSGGNQQKTMLAKWIALEPEILIDQ